MKQNIPEISDAIQFAQKLLDALKKLRRHHEESLKTWHGSKGNVYYVRENGRYRYLKKNEIELAKALAQQEYDDELAKELLKMIECGKEFKQYIANPPWVRVLDTLAPAKQELIMPPVQSDKELCKEWLAYAGESLAYEIEKRICPSLRGELFRSKSEASVADILDSFSITYVYEHSLFLEIPGKMVYPDFRIFMPHTGREIILEHFGMVDIPEYAENMVKKINMFIANGYRLGVDLFFTFESSSAPLDKSVVVNIARQILEANQ